MCTSGSISLISPCGIVIREKESYLYNQILDKLLVRSLITVLLGNHLMLSFLIDLLNKRVDCLHLLNSSNVLFSRLLNSQFDLVLLELVFIVINNGFLLLSNVVLLLDGELIFSLFANCQYSFISVSFDESYHRFKNLIGLCRVHI
jgi:hypothetical protein